MGTASAQTDARVEQLAKAKLLYSCFHFFNESSAAAESPQKEQLRGIADQFAARAAAEVAAADPRKDSTSTQLADRISGEGRTEFMTMMEEVARLPAGPEGKKRIARFAESCTAALGSKQ